MFDRVKCLTIDPRKLWSLANIDLSALTPTRALVFYFLGYANYKNSKQWFTCQVGSPVEQLLQRVMRIGWQMALRRLMARPVIRMISRRSGDRFRDVVARRVLQILQEGRYRLRRKSLEILCASTRHVRSIKESERRNANDTRQFIVIGVRAKV